MMRSFYITGWRTRRKRRRKLLDQKYLTAVAKLEDRQLLGFYTGLYTMGVNCLAVNYGTNTQIIIQLTELVVRKDPAGLPEGKKSSGKSGSPSDSDLFYAGDAPSEKPQPTDELKELQEELLAHYSKGSYIIAVQPDNQIPVLKLKNGDVYQPVFTDILELQKFIKGKKMRTAVIAAEKIPDILVGEAKGVVLNPMGVNVQLNVARKKKPVKPGNEE